MLWHPGLYHKVGWYLMLRLKAEDKRSRQWLPRLVAAREAAHEWQLMSE